MVYERMDFSYKAMVAETGVADTRDELDIYLSEPVENPKMMVVSEYNVLSWCSLNCGKYPILAEMAKDVFAMQVSHVAFESAFSTSGRMLDPYKSCLTHYMIEVLICTEKWMKCDLCFPDITTTTNTEILADVVLHDTLEKDFESL